MARREIVRASAKLVVSRDYNPASHAEPAYRGGYLLLVPGKIPEIVLDGMVDIAEQKEAERRCLEELERRQTLGTVVPPEGVSQDSLNSESSLGSRGTQGPQALLGPGARPRSKGLLGQQLIAAGLLTVENLQRMLERQKALPPDRPVRRLGSLLVEVGLLTMRQVSEALGAQHGIQASTGQSSRIDPSVQALFPRDLLYQIQAVPVCIVGKTVAVAMADPHDQEQIKQLQALTKFTVRPMQAPQLQVHRLLESMKSPRSLRVPGSAGSVHTPPTPTTPVPDQSKLSPALPASLRSQRSPAVLSAKTEIPAATSLHSPVAPVAAPRSQRRLSYAQRVVFVSALLLGISFALSTGLLVSLRHSRATPTKRTRLADPAAPATRGPQPPQQDSSETPAQPGEAEITPEGPH